MHTVTLAPAAQLPSAGSSPAPKAGRPSVDEAAQLTQRIVAVATQLFVANGYAATSVDAIVRGAGISKKTLYARFADKAQVFDAVVESHVLRHLGMPQDDVPPTGTLQEQLNQVGARLLVGTLHADVLGIYRVAVAESLQFPQLMRKVFDAAVLRAVEQVERLFLAALVPPPDARQARQLAMHFMNCAISPPFYRAMQGLEPAGFDDARRAQLHTAVAYFLHGVLGVQGRSPQVAG